MSDNTKIEWATHTFNPWIGCTKVSPGCAHCYAEARDRRLGGGLHWGKGAPRQRTSAATWRNPVKWQRHLQFRCPKCKAVGKYRDVCETLDCLTLGQELEVVEQRVFPSLCDWLDDEVPLEWLADFLALIERTQNLTWLLLTKRPELFKERLARALTCVMTHGTATDERFRAAKMVESWLNGNPPAHVWVGTSVEDQIRADERIPALIRIPAAVRFLSVEPLLGPVKLNGPFDGPQAFPIGMGIQWVIVGGESGKDARVCAVNWISEIVTCCRLHECAVFVKQLGSRPCRDYTTPGKGPFANIKGEMWTLKHPKGGDPDEWPDSLQVREFPA